MDSRAAKRRGQPGHVPRLEKYWYFNIMSKISECAPSRDHRAPAVPRLVPKAGLEDGDHGVTLLQAAIQSDLVTVCASI